MERERLMSVGQTVASISHAIKNILQGLRGGAGAIELAIDRGDLELAKQGWPILSRNLDRIHDLTFNMLAYTRARSLDLEPHHVNDSIEEAVRLMRRHQLGRSFSSRNVRALVAFLKTLDAEDVQPWAYEDWNGER